LSRLRGLTISCSHIILGPEAALD